MLQFYRSKKKNCMWCMNYRHDPSSSINMQMYDEKIRSILFIILQLKINKQKLTSNGHGLHHANGSIRFFGRITSVYLYITTVLNHQQLLNYSSHSLSSQFSFSPVSLISPSLHFKLVTADCCPSLKLVLLDVSSS